MKTHDIKGRRNKQVGELVSFPLCVCIVNLAPLRVVIITPISIFIVSLLISIGSAADDCEQEPSQSFTTVLSVTFETSRCFQIAKGSHALRKISVGDFPHSDKPHGFRFFELEQSYCREKILLPF